MESKQFSVGEVVKYGWKTMKSHLFFFIVLLIVGALLTYLPAVGAIWAQNANQPTWVWGLLFLLQLVLGCMVGLGFMRVSLSFVDKEKPHIGQLFTVFPKIFSYFIASVIYFIILLVGLCLLVFPGVIWGLRYMLYPYFILDKGAGPIEALKLSAESTMGAKWDLFAFFMVAYVIVLIGTLCLAVGLFAALPVVMVGSAYIYRRLAG